MTSKSSIWKFVLTVTLVLTQSLISLPPMKVGAEAGLLDQNVPETICLPSAPRLENFPNIALDFRPLDSDHNIVTGLSSNDIQAQENTLEPVPANVGMSPEGEGLNLYFVVDIGNRTDLQLVASTLQSFSTMTQDNVDEVTIISDKGSGYDYILKTTKSLGDFQKAIQNIPVRSSDYFTINSALSQALNDIKSQNYGCSRSNLIVVLAGGDALYSNLIDYQKYITEANAAWIKSYFLLYPNSATHILSPQDVFEKIANGTHGLYRQITKAGDITASLSMLDFERERRLYTATYRTNNGESSDRNVKLLYQSKDITEQAQTYVISILNPVVTITSPADGTVIQLSSSGSSTPANNLVDVEFSLSWPDGHLRNLKSASLLVTSPSGTKTEMSISTGVPLKFNWNIGEYESQNVNALSIKVTVTDEFGLTATSQAVAIKIKYIPTPTQLPSSPSAPLAPKTTAWLLYVLYAVVAILLVSLIVMSRKLRTLASSGAIKRFVENVRKTIIGGRSRKDKPLAVLKVIDGPASLVNQDLKIYSESVKLGRDPEKADLIFYTPEAKTSISGLHCRIERIGGAWRIVALSASGSETFVEDQTIPFNEPYPLLSGQTVRMGYLAQQPVVFQFIVEQSSEQAREEAGEKNTVPDEPIRIVEPKIEKPEPKIENPEPDERKNADDRPTRVKVPDAEGNIASSEDSHAPKTDDDNLFAEFRDK